MKEAVDQILHLAWTLVFILPLVLWPSPYTALWAGQWFWPRELVDQWHGWPLGRGKIRDIISFEIAALILAGGYLYAK